MDQFNLNPIIHVISTETILTMCGKCGNKHGAALTARALKATLKSMEPKHN